MSSYYDSECSFEDFSELEPAPSFPPGALAPPVPATPIELPPLNLEIKYVNEKYNDKKHTWDHEDVSREEVPLAELVHSVGMKTANESSDWSKYCFVLIHRHSKPDRETQVVTISVECNIICPYLRTLCRKVMQNVPGISWDSEPVVLTPQHLITFFPRFEEMERGLTEKTPAGEHEERILASLRVLLSWMRKNYPQTLTRIKSLISHGEITFDLLYTVLLPGSIIIQRCPITGEARALRLLNSSRCVRREGLCYQLRCEGLEEAISTPNQDPRWSHGEIGDSGEAPGQTRSRFGLEENVVLILAFEGVQKINTLSAFPIEYHPDPAGLTSLLVSRARSWAALAGMHHVHYHGTAFRKETMGFEPGVGRYTVDSQVMIDKLNLARFDANYPLPTPKPTLRGSKFKHAEFLTDEDLLLASPILYGYSLSDRMWLELNVNHITQIKWNDEVFDDLVLPPKRKAFLRSLVEAHNLSESNTAGFDDFVRGKGQGLVINLFGPPGVGKTLSAEATSEHLRRPLFMVGSGALGVNAQELEQRIGDVFSLAACWNAVLLIDEADVFLERRSLHDMERNAMVAVFLRQVEYYRGILFLTTNRIKTYDKAFLSRIHVALHFDELTAETKTRIWLAFMLKAGFHRSQLADTRLEELASREINGRQIKNACRTAMALARSRGEEIQFEHIEEALDAMEAFLSCFAQAE